MSEDKHTPLPWAIEDPMCDDLWIVEAGKEPYEWRCIASVQATPPDEGLELSRVEMHANAALIVRSVHSLPALVKALEEIVDVKPGMVTDDELKIAVMKMRNVAICALAAYRSSPK